MGLGKVLPNMDKKRVYSFAREIITTVINEGSPYMTEDAKSSLMGST